ncbi:hypothetical protein LGH82_02860 [Mesorhizobium sp. PAMC28654]|uniref:hypothetical protein n=1 Tax=Mesorhizobium sp. PAMC28654 TaxID=2880934 RepID=UPI001D0B80DA|nr:hypothetical protein [Mesorhizobium sp. PAMC28654]UDL92976.1 hypothetical protein LGH82_02860 [Mesorhizobium sp. PAMC28654]
MLVVAHLVPAAEVVVAETVVVPPVLRSLLAFRQAVQAATTMVERAVELRILQAQMVVAEADQHAVVQVLEA